VLGKGLRFAPRKLARWFIESDFMYYLILGWYFSKLPELNAWLSSEVSRMNLPSLRLVPPFVVDESMLEPDGVHLLPTTRDSFLAQLSNNVQLAIPVLDEVTLVDDFTNVGSSEDESDESANDQATTTSRDRLGTILQIVKSNARRLGTVKPLRDALMKLDEWSTAFEAQVRIRRQRDNLVFARLKEEADSELNRSRENRVAISGLDRLSSGSTSHSDKKAHYQKLVTDLVTKVCPDADPKPTVLDVFVNLNKNQVSPSIEATFDSVSGALSFRKAALALDNEGCSKEAYNYN
jgi:hypothetical protein